METQNAARVLGHSRCILPQRTIPEKLMSTSPHRSICSELITSAAEGSVGNSSQPLLETWPVILTGDRLLVVEAMSLLIRLDQDLRKARAQFNQDWFRRIMRARHNAVARLRRRWSKISPAPTIPLGSLRRRYHANLAKYLYG